MTQQARRNWHQQEAIKRLEAAKAELQEADRLMNEGVIPATYRDRLATILDRLNKLIMNMKVWRHPERRMRR